MWNRKNWGQGFGSRMGMYRTVATFAADMAVAVEEDDSADVWAQRARATS